MSNIGIEQRNVNLIDWRKISTNITDGLEKEMQRREELKTKIDDDTRKLEEDISKTPIGNNDRVNGWISQYSSMATENLLAINRALKNGGVNPRDYTTFLANSKSSTTRVFDAIKAYNEEAKVVNERTQKGISSKQELQFMGMIEGFADLSKSMPVFQSDGTLQIVKMKDGKQIDGADGRVTINQLMGIMGMRINKFDMNGAAESAVEGMGDFVKEALATEGGAKSLAQVLKIKDKSQIGQLDEKGRVIESTYSKSEQLFTDQILSSDWNVASILFDHSGGVVNGKAYQITQDPEVAKKGENYVLYSYIDGKLQPDFSSNAPNGAKQRKIAEQLVKDNIRSRIDKEVTIRTERPQIEPKEPVYEWQARRGDELKDARDVGNLLGYLYSGDGAQLKTAVDFINGLTNVLSTDRNEKGFTIKFKDGSAKEVTFRNEDGSLKTQDDFIRSVTSSVFGDKYSINEVVRGARSTGRSKFNETGTARATTTVPEQQESGDIRSAIIGKIGTNVNAINIKGAKEGEFLDDEDVLSAVQPLLTKLGLNARTYYKGQGLVITRKNGKKAEIAIDKNFQENLIAVLEDAVPPDTGDKAIGGILEKIATGLGVTGAAAKWNKKKTD